MVELIYVAFYFTSRKPVLNLRVSSDWNLDLVRILVFYLSVLSGLYFRLYIQIFAGHIRVQISGDSQVLVPTITSELLKSTKL